MANTFEVKTYDSGDLSKEGVSKTSLLNDFEFTDALDFDQEYEGVPITNFLPGVAAPAGTGQGIQFQTDKAASVGYLQSKNYSSTDATGWRIDTAGNADFNGTTSMRAFRLINRFIAGENLTAGRLLCFKNKEATWGDGNDSTADRDTTAILSAFTDVDQDNPTTATGANPNLVRLGITSLNNFYYVYGKLDLSSSPPGLPAWNELERVLLRVYVAFAASTGQVSNLYRLTASFTESTITWNNKPADDNVAWASGQVLSGEILPSDKATTGNLATTGYIEYDITELYRLWSDGTYTNNGFVIKTSGSAGNGNASIRGRSGTSGGSFNQAPFLAIIITQNNPGSGNTITANDGKVYHASNADYHRVKSLAGICGTTVSAGETVDVYTLADKSTIPTSVLSVSNNKVYYLSGTSGQISTLTNDIIEHSKWDIRLGVGSPNGLVVDVDKKPIFIRAASTGTTTASGIIPPPNAGMAIIDAQYTAGGKDHRFQITMLKDRVNDVIQEHSEIGGSKQHKVQATWASGTTGKFTITFTDTDATSGLGCTVYWYK